MNETPQDLAALATAECTAPEDQQIELLNRYDEALANGSTLQEEATVDLDAAGRARLEENQRCLQLLEQLFPRRQHFHAEHEWSGAEAEPVSGKQLGRFTVVRELGRGGFGIVYLAEDPVLCRQVALKVPRADAIFSLELRARFLREAKAAGRLNHPNLIRVLDAGQTGPLCYLVSDYCPGPTLAVWLKTNTPCQPTVAARIVAAVARAVAYIHSQGILHRDIKPSNILLEPARDALASNRDLPFTPRLTDFGLARLVDFDGTETATGAILGTPAYMAPEQACGRGKEIGPASDVYSLGAILYELCAGQLPFAGSEPLELLTRVISGDITPLRQVRRDVPRDLEAICSKCLERDPSLRYATGDALADDFQRFLEGRPTAARPASLWKRCLKQTRRRPAVAIATALGLLLVLGSTTGGAWFLNERSNHRQVVSKSRSENLIQAAQIEEATRARQRLQNEQYAFALRQAAEHWREKHEAMDEALDRCRPGSGEEDLREFTYSYLWQHPRRLRLLGRHTGPILFTTGGLLGASNDVTIRRWDLESRQVLQSVTMDKRAAGMPAFSADGQRVATFWPPHETPVVVRLWDTTAGKQLGELNLTWKSFANMAIAPGGDIVAVAGASDDRTGRVMLWDPATGQSKVVWSHLLLPAPDNPTEFAGGPTAVAFSRDGQHLAIAFGDCDASLPPEQWKWSCQVLDLHTGQAGPPLLGSTSYVNCMAFSADGTQLAAGDFSANVVVWDLANGRKPVRLDGLAHPISCLAFAPDGQALATGMYWQNTEVESNQDYLVVWDLKTRICRGPPLDHGFEVRSVSFSLDGNTLAFACQDNTVRLWNLTSESFVLPAHSPAEAWGIAFAPNGPLFVTCGDDCLAKLWDVETKQEIRQFAGAPNLLLAVAFAPDRPLLATAGWDGVVRLWNTESGPQERELTDHQGPVRSVAFSPNGKLLASAGDDKTVNVWNAASGEILFTLDGHSNKVRQVVFAGDGQTLFSGGNDGIVNAWQTTTGNLIQALSVNAEVWSMAHSPTEELLAIATKEGLVELRGTDSWELRARLSGHTDGVLCVAFSPDGKTLASGSLDRSVRLWHVPTGQELLSFKDLPAQINGVAFSADGRTLGATCHDGSTILWQADR